MNLELDEGDRQMVLLALAHLSIERPGWDDALNRIARKIDNRQDDRAVMYDEFRRIEVQVNPPTFWERISAVYTKVMTQVHSNSKHSSPMASSPQRPSPPSTPTSRRATSPRRASESSTSNP